VCAENSDISPGSLGSSEATGATSKQADMSRPQGLQLLCVLGVWLG
jgi:hypothetical protein